VVNIASAIAALREDRFGGFWQGCTAQERTKLAAGHIDVRYANWFSGLGMNLLQLASFVRPAAAQLLLADGHVEIDLHSACALGDTRLVEEIIASSPGALDTQIDTYHPIQYALGHPEVVRLLLSHGDDPNRPIEKLAWFEWEDRAAMRRVARWRPMHMVALGRSAECVDTAEVLVEFGADLMAYAEPFAETPLHIAAIFDRSAIIRWFVDQGVDVDIPTGIAELDASELFDSTPFQPFVEGGKTALMLALGEGHADAAEGLVTAGANVHARDNGGFTPLHYAAGSFWQEQSDLVRRLLSLGALPTPRDASGRQAIDLARDKGYGTVVAILESGHGGVSK